MKKTPFLSYILAALLAGSAAPHAYGYDEEVSDDTYALTDWSYPDEDFVPNVLNVGEDADDESDDYWGDVVMDRPIYVWSTNGIITNGSVSCPVYIFAGSKLTLAAAQDGLRAADLVYWSGTDIDLSELDKDQKVMIYMENNSTLDYRDKDVRLGLLTTYSDNTVYIQCGNLVTEEFGSTWDFTINAKIQLKDSNSHLWIARYTKSVTLNCEQNMNLHVGDDRVYIYNGQYYGVSGDGCKLNNCTLNLPDNKTSNIYGYLGGTSTITLGNGTTVQGWNETTGSIQHVSWLTNNIVVRENCSATMQTGYYGGTITMRIGSSLKFDMDAIPAGVDPDHLEGGAKVSMFGNNTLDLAGRATALDVTVVGTGNTVKNGTITSRMTLEDYASLDWYGGDMNLSTSGVTLGRNAVLNLHGKTINGDVWCASGARVEHGTITGWFNMADGETYSWWALGNAGLTLRGGVCLGDNTTLDLDDTNNTYTHSIALKGSATIGNGKLDGAFSVGEGKVLTLCGDFSGTGAVTLYEGAKLDLAAHKLVRDVTLGGSATITGGEIDGTLTVNSGKRLTLGGDLTGTDTISLKGGAALALDNHVLTKAVTVGSSSLVTISGGTIDIGVSLQDNANLSLESVTLGGNTSFTLGDGSRLNLSGASGIAWLNLADHTTVTVSNGRMGLPGAPDNPLDAMEYTLTTNQDGTPVSIEGGYKKVKLGANVTFATRHNTRYVVADSTVPANIDVVAEGHFLLGKGSGTRLHANVSITHTGEGPSDPGTNDVDLIYWLIGDLNVKMGGRSISAGTIGDYKSTEEQTSTASITDASKISLEAFTGKSMKLQASESVLLTGATKASGKVEIGGSTGAAAGSAGPEISIQTILQANELEMSGKTITGSGNPGGDENPTWLAFTTGTIEATDTISITQEIRGGDMTMKAGKSITLDLLGMGDPQGMGEHTLGSADITSDTAGITAKSFTGGALKATAMNGAVTINGAVNATSGGKWELEGIGIADPLAVAIKGTSVSIDGSLDAGAETGRVYIKSTGGNITIGKDSSTPLSAGDSSTLDSAAGITVLGNVTHGNLKASAGQSITLQNISIDKKDANLRAGGSISAGSFTGNYLEAEANGAVTFHGNVASTDNTRLTGASVSINGSLNANAETGWVFIKSTGGDITIGKDSSTTLSAAVSSTLDSARDITIKGNVTKGNLTATAAQSIQLKDISIRTNDNDAALTATGGSITAANFDGGSLTAKAAEAVAFSGNVASRNNASLTGASVGVNGSITTLHGRTLIASTGGAIVIGGTLSSGTSSTLQAEAGETTTGSSHEDGSITIEGDVIHGALTATAANSIKLKDIIIGTNDAELTATGGSITAGAFTGGNLKANAKGAVTINGDVEASGADKWQLSTDEDAPAYAVVLEGSGVSVNGSLTASADQNYVKSTGGDINITGTLNAALSSTLDSAGNITLGGDVTGGVLTATAAQSIQLKDISINANNAALTATGGSITAGDVTAGKLTATAAGTITMNNVAVSQSEAQIVSTGEGGNVVLRSFSGGGALIKATRGSITVATGATGSASTNKNTFIAAGSVTFNGATGNNSLSHTIINAPQVNWSNGTTLKDVTVSHWAPPANSPLLLPAAGEDPVATLTVNGFLELTDYSTVIGNVVINKQDNIIPTVTVDHSTITGQVSGATELVLDSGRVGNVVVDNNRPNDLNVVSSGTSSITGVPFEPYVENYAKLRIATLSLNGGKLTVSPKAQDDPDYPDYPVDMENSDEEKARLQVATLMVANNTTVAADLELLPIGENEFSTMIFNLSAANETTACLTLEGDLLSYIPGGFTPKPGGKISISLNGNADVEGGKRYALIATNYDVKPDFWNDKNLTLTVSGLAQKTDDLSWENGTLYFQNGGELTRAVWSPETSHQWNTTDQNWLQDGHRYRYKDGVTVVFDDTGKGGVVELEGDYAPGEVQVNNSAENAYTFTGSGKITGESTKLIKMGSGKLTIQTANSYGGGTTINEGTLVVAHDEALGSGEVILEGGALEIDNGPKKFRLTVTGQNTRLEGGGHDAFTGTLTLRVGSQLNSSGGALMATQYGIDHIVMENGSTLTMTSDDDNAHRIWINKISDFTVYAGTEQDAPKLVDTYLYIDSGLTYKLGATTGENINSLQNLRGEGSTAFLLDSSTLDLNSKTTKLNIIVDNVLPQGPSTVMGGEIDANVVVCEKTNPSADPNELKVTHARIGNNASISLGAGTRLIMSDVAIVAGATFSMGNAAYLDLGGTFPHPSSVSLGAFTFTGASATIDNGTLLVAAGESVQLNTELLGDAIISLGKEANLDLNGHTLASSKIELADDSATVSGGQFSGDVTVQSGKTLRLGVDQSIAGDVTLEKSTSTLSLGTGCSVEGAISGSGTIVKENGGTASVSGGMQGFTGSLEVRDGSLNLMNAASQGVLDVTIGANSTLGVFIGGDPTPETAQEGILTVSGTLAAQDAHSWLNANLVMKAGSTLDVSATGGNGGLHMGSTVTLAPGNVLLSEDDMDAIGALGFMGKYDLFNGVDGLSLDGTTDFLWELGLADKWVKAADVFANPELSAEKEYYLFYSGVNQGGVGGNVGTVYLMQIPEPTTGTLSLLALAALAARRRRK